MKKLFLSFIILFALQSYAQVNQQEMMKKANEIGIKFTSCEFAMNKLGVKKKQYLDFVQTTPNAFIYLFEFFTIIQFRFR